MLSTQGHTFRRQARLAITLACVAGYTNLVSVIAIGTVTSHVSGTASNLRRDVVERRWDAAGHAIVLLVSFVIGAGASAVMTETARRRGWRSMYLLPIATEVALLILFAAGLQMHDHRPPAELDALYWIGAVAAAAMGLQNATITRISGGVVRTTHVTGVLTDIGLDGVRFTWHWLEHRRRLSFLKALRDPLGKRVLLLVAIGGSFTLGAAIGTGVFMWSPTASMYIPPLFMLWLLWREVARPVANIEAISPRNPLVGHDAAIDPAMVAPGVHVYQLRHDADREGEAHSAPNFQLWAESLPPDARVVVLDLSAARTQSTDAGVVLDANALADLREAKRRFIGRSTRLVLAGADPAHFEALRDVGAFDVIDPQNICTDLEFALARAQVLLESTNPRAARD